MAYALSIQPKPTPWLTNNTDTLYLRLKDADTGAVGPSLTGATFAGKLVQGSTSQALVPGNFAIVDGPQCIFSYVRAAADVATLTPGRYLLQVKITLSGGAVIEPAAYPVDVGTGA